MAIAALPQGTVQLLGSAQALTTSTSLVKELIDNALDAKATSVEVVISSNTIDKVEVRDNGHGIHQEDLDALGRRGHTSKLRSFDELKSIGGLSLGFRGEALASAVQLGEVSVTTKTEGEAVATKVTLKAPGGIAKKIRTSAPVGTTVSVSNFMFKLPVRKQTALKEATKTLAKIKELLQAYALARLHVRFSLKVLKGAKGSWSFAPRPQDGIKEAVTQIFGKDAALGCVEKTLSFPERHYGKIRRCATDEEDDTESTSVEGSAKNFTLQLFLPKPDADPTKIGLGQYISIDSRPVSHEKGTMRRIITLYKCSVKGHSDSKLKSPFLRLNIKCPEGSYDPNVEPAKDDVLFGNEYLILESVESFLKEFYGERQPSPEISSRKSTKPVDAFDLLLARKPNASTKDDHSVQTQCPTKDAEEFGNIPVITPSQIRGLDLDSAKSGSPVQNAEQPGNLPKTTPCRWDFDMSNDYTEIVSDSTTIARPSKKGPLARDSGEEEDSTRNELNPWLIAKLNVPVRNDASRVPITPRRIEAVEQTKSNHLLTPQPSSDPPSTEIDNPCRQSATSCPRRVRSSEDLLAFATPDILHPLPQASPFPGDSRSIRRPNRPSIDPEVEDESLLVGDNSETFRRRNDFVTAKTVANNNSSVSPPSFLSLPKTRKVKNVNKPFVPPTRLERGTSVPPDNFRQTRILDFTPTRPQTASMQGSLELEPDSDVSWAMDFEQRKEVATRRRRAELRAARLELEASEKGEVIRSSPHKNRYNAAIATLEADQSLAESSGTLTNKPFKTLLPDGDSRAYLMRRQKSRGGKPEVLRKMSRAQSMRLPLETTPEAQTLHTLLHNIDTEPASLPEAVRRLAEVDTYVKHGRQCCGLDFELSERDDITTKIKAVVNKWVASEEGNGCEVTYNVDNPIHLL